METGIVLEHRDVGAPGDATGPLRRLTPAAYADGDAAPRDSAADPREVAFEVFSQGDADIPNPFGLSALWIFWGQFLDHDLDLTPEQEGPDAELLKIDPPFDVVRSEYLEGTSPREQPNVVTPLIDGSNVYGSDADRLAALRTGEGGRLKAQPGPDGTDLLPDAAAVFGPGEHRESGFTAGDIRAQENAGLSAFHNLWLNEHNAWADRLAAENPDWDDPTIFENARAVVEALLQKITYEEFLPVLLGDALGDWEGHDPGLDPQVSTEFSTAAYRFGHTSIPDAFPLVGEGGEGLGVVPLFEAFENDSVLLDNGLAALVRGLAETPAQAIDTKVVDSLNRLLFTPDGLVGFSLPERNLLRGHDHGIPPWLEVREAVVGDLDAEILGGSTDFSLVTANPEVAADLAAVYPTLGDIDLWAGGLAEDALPGLAVGPTVHAILADQFARARDGDPLWWEGRTWTDAALLAEIEQTRLSDVLVRSGGLEHVQRDALLASDRTGGTDGRDRLAGDGDRDLLIGFRGRDTLDGDEGDDDLFGDEGRDQLLGGGGDDGLDGGRGADTLLGGMGDDSLLGGDGADYLVGGFDDDTLEGGAGGDILMGWAGDDVLAGGDGRDMLFGGDGADRFHFTAGERGHDILCDFEVGLDVLVLEGFSGTDGIEIYERSKMVMLFVDDEKIAHIQTEGGPLTEDDILFVG